MATNTPGDMMPNSLVAPLQEVDAETHKWKPVLGPLTEDQQRAHLAAWIAENTEGMSAREKASFALYQRLDTDPSRWEVYVKVASALDTTLYNTESEANAEIARLMKGHTGTNKWVAYRSEDPTDIAVGGGAGWRIKENPAVVDRVDPKNPLAQDPIDLGNGTSLFILSTGQTFTAPTGVSGWDDWDPETNVQTVGSRKFAILPNGDTVDVSEDKVYGAGDITIVENTEMQDGSVISVLSDGSIINTGPAKPPTEAKMGASGYWEVRDANGNLSLKQPLYEPGIDYTDAGFNILSGPQGPIQDLGLPEVPSTIETIGGQQFVRGTTGELRELDNALDRAIDYAIISGQGDKARDWDDFRKRPDSLTALEKAMEWARTPGDQALISDLHYMTSGQAAAAGESALGRGAGFFSEVAPPPQFAQDAWKRFQDSMTGGSLPTEEDFAAALAMEEEPPPRTMREQLEDSLAQTKIDAAQAKIDRENEIHEALLISNKAESEARVKAIQDQAARDQLAFDNEQNRLDRSLDAKIGQPTGATSGTTGDTPGANGDTPGANGGTKVNEEPATAKWVYSTGTDRWILDADGTFDVSAQPAGSFLLEGDPNAPDISLYDTTINEDGVFTGTGKLKEGTQSRTPEEDPEPVYDPDIHKGDYNMDGKVDYQERARWNADSNNPRNQVIPDPDPIQGPTPLGRRDTYVDTAQEALPLTKADTSLPLPTTPLDRTDTWVDMGEEAIAPQTSGGEMPDLDEPYEAPTPVTLGSGRTLSEAQADARDRGDTQSRQDMLLSRDVEAIQGIPSVAWNLGSTLAGSSGIPSALGVAGGALQSLYGMSPGAQRREAAVAEERRQDWESRHQAEGARGLWNEGEYGTRTDDRITLVGESGPELALFPNGTEIIPLDREMQPSQKRRLRRRGIRGMQDGGLVFDREPSRGISQFISGREVGPSQGRIFRRAGFTTPSAQALRNILPEELEEFRRMGARARIHEGTFERELAQGIASGTRRSNSARFLPLSLRS